MRNTTRRTNNLLSSVSGAIGSSNPRSLVIAVVLLTALFAFEMFNFDTTRYALNSLLGNVTFMNLSWATILAIAFCAIDFAGLAHLFTPEKGKDEPREVWYLMGAWLLGATMNAMMTWWAVSLTLLNHDLGNEVLSREQLLRIVPIFVATLVWLTRILFIGSLTVAGEHLFDFHGQQATKSKPAVARSSARPKTTSRSVPKPARRTPAASFSAPQELTYVDEPEAYAAQAPQRQSKPVVNRPAPQPVRQPVTSQTPARTSRIQRRPTVGGGNRNGMPVGMRADGQSNFDTRKKMS